MTSLTVRRPVFPIDDSVAFQWQSASLTFGLGEWHAAYDAGADIITYAGARL